MDVIAGGRGTGRTTELIKRAAESEKNGEVCYIVCHSQREAFRIAKQAEEMGLSIGFPLTYDEFLEHQYTGKNIKKFYIDNAESLLRMLTPIPIGAITITTDV